jgi:hypothetical protein
MNRIIKKKNKFNTNSPFSFLQLRLNRAAARRPRSRSQSTIMIFTSANTSIQLKSLVKKYDKTVHTIFNPMRLADDGNDQNNQRQHKNVSGLMKETNNTRRF